MSCDEKPLYDQTMLTTGISMFGKMSVGVRRIASGPAIRMRIASTAKVYGRRRASRTIHMTNVFEREGVRLIAIDHAVDAVMRARRCGGLQSADEGFAGG